LAGVGNERIVDRAAARLAFSGHREAAQADRPDVRNALSQPRRAGLSELPCWNIRYFQSAFFQAIPPLSTGCVASLSHYPTSIASPAANLAWSSSMLGNRCP
jgi:hypothetical protein